MRSSTWQALGNAYVLVEPGGPPLDADDARARAGSSDGVLEVRSVVGNELDVVVWNSDGSTAELSGNGTRIVASWHLERTGAQEALVRVGVREVSFRLLADGLLEQELGPVVVGEPEVVAGVELVPVDVGNPHAVVLGDPGSIASIGPLLESHARFPQRTNVQVAHVEEPGVVVARVWERGVGETLSSGTSAAAVAAATHGSGQVRVRFPGGELLVRIAKGRATLLAPPAERVGATTR